MSVITAMGTYHIWISLIAIPILVVILATLLVVLLVQKKRTTSTARLVRQLTCELDQLSKDVKYNCSVQVSVDGLEGTYSLHVQNTEASIKSGTSWQVSYIPDQIGTSLSSSSIISEKTTIFTSIAISVLILILVIVWILNLKLRKNADFRDFSGVLEGSELMSGLVQGFN
jgi:Flp pilus assembly protein TadB